MHGIQSAVRGNYETGNQAFSKRLRFLTIRAHFLSELCHYALNIHVRPFPEELSTQCSRQADACGCRKGTAFRSGGTNS